MYTNYADKQKPVFVILYMNLKRFLKHLLLNIRNGFIKTESIFSSKSKWDELAKENAEYYIWSDKKDPSPKEFRNSGSRDYRKYIKEDDLLQEKLKILKTRIALEIGCGIGRITEFLGEDFEKVYGVDISSEMIRRAKGRLPGAKFVFIENDGLTVPLESESIDFVFSFIVFQHMPSFKTVESNFKEANRVLKRNGIFKVQLRGNLVDKKEWFYGVGFNRKGALKLAERTNFKVLNFHKETERYSWLLLQKSN